MARSFGIVEAKISETDFFLDKIEGCSHSMKFFEIRNYMSAFLSASRSITFALQASLTGVSGFEEWYQQKQTELKNNQLAKYFLEARNASQKIGYYGIYSGGAYTDESGKRIYRYFFDNSIESTPQEDVLSACKAHFTTLLQIVLDCYKQFGPSIDPEQYFTATNLKALNKTIEDFEEELGFPRGWTKVDGLTDEIRIELLRNHVADPCVDHILIKFLGKNRFGEVV